MENRCNSLFELSFDVDLVVDDIKIPANKMILSGSSPYFQGMFGTHFRERDQEAVEISGICAESLKLIVNYVYTSEVQISKENVQDLLTAANILQYPYICYLSRKFMKHHLDSTNCLGVQMYAEFYQFQDLYDEATNFINQNFTEVAKSEEFLNLSLIKISEIISSDLLDVEEEKVFESVLNWVRHDLDLRHRHLMLLMKSIRICCMALSYKNHTLLTEPLLQIHPKFEDFVSEALEPFRAKGDPKTITDKCGQFRGSPKVLLVMGGTDEMGIDCFNFKTGTWYRMDGAPCRMATAVAVMDGKLQIIGGWGEGKIRMYNPATGKLSPGNALEAYWPIYNAVTLGKYIYAIGMDWYGLAPEFIEIIDPKIGGFPDLITMKSKRGSGGVAVVNDLLYIVGGSVYKTRYKSVLCYNPITGKLRNVEDMHFKRKNVGVAVIDSILYAVGGNDGFAALRSVEAFNPKTGTWTIMCSMNEYREGAAVVAANNLLYVIGGTNCERRASKSVEVYDPATNIWTLLPNRMSISRSRPLAAVVDMPDRIKDRYNLLT